MSILDPIYNFMSSVLEGLYTFTVTIGFPSYAIAIVLFTFIIRVLLSPLGWKQQVSMKRMAEVQPIQAKLQKKYGQNKELYSQKVMELYKKRKINPLSGCLPLLVQLPIIWIFYRMLFNHAQNDSFGTGPEAYFFGFKLADTYSFNFAQVETYILPVVVAASAFLMTKVTTMIQKQKKTVITNSKGKSKEVEAPSNPMQGQMKYMNVIMAGMMAFIMTVVPSGMALYFLTYNLVQVLQTILFNKILDIQKKKREALNEAEALGTG